MKNSLGIYIHVPFCKRKCRYCNFYSVCDKEELIEKYLHRVCSEIENWGKKLNKKVNTIYFGGGTPSLMGSKKIALILESIIKNFKVTFPEITVEVNPADYNFSDFEILRYAGVNRISIGAQSLEDKDLKMLGRRHAVNDIFNTYNFIKKANINNISMDLIIGFPNQTMESLKKFIQFSKENSIPHISAYLLKIEEGTFYFKNKSKLNFLSEDKCSDFYLYFSDELKKCGYNHYEVSNFAFLGKESSHNLKYWNLEDYLGIGPSAHSLINGQRFYYAEDVNEFILNPILKYESAGGTLEEFLMLKLRLKKGITNEEFKNKFGGNIPHYYFERAKKFENLDLVKLDKNKISLTTKGFLLSNYVISNIIW